jgi:tetratricopeptide (TPR) repeat protein
MKRLIHVHTILACLLLFAAAASAQNNGRIDGQVMDLNGAPYANVTVTITNPDNGFSKTTTTDKAGKFVQIGMGAGTYTLTLTNDKDKLNFTQKVGLTYGQDLPVVIDLKKIAAEQAGSPEAQKKETEEANLFKDMKVHFDAGLAAMSDASDLRKQLPSAPADQKSVLQGKLSSDYQTAITELDLAEKGVSPKDAKNHAVVLANLAQAYDFDKKYDDAVTTYQKAIDLAPSAGLYSNLSTSQANAALAVKDPAGMQQKLTDASGDCDKAIALDPTSASKCWKNLGIVLSNTGHMPESVGPLQKATAADPKDAQAWFLLGGSLTAMIVPSQQGDKLTYQVPPGTTDAYQKCIDAAPTGPYAQQAKEALDNLAAISGGVSTTEGQKSAAPAPKKKKS